MDTEIIDAIKSQNLIEICYNNEAQIIEPYCYGITQAGEEVLIGFQVSPPIEEQKGWKHFDLNKANDLNVLLETFQIPRSDFKNHSKKVAKIFAER